MQEREKKKIVLASVLKPVNEIRMFSKIATSLETVGYDVSIIGYPPAGAFPQTPIHLYPMGTFHRLSIKRVLAPLRIFRKWLALKPDILVVSTHELLFWGVLTRLFTRTHVIYDVQENYYLNILHTSAFPSILRAPLAAYVRTIEYLTAPFVHHFLLAESIYAHQLPFVKGRYTVLENKHVTTDHQAKNLQTGYHKLLFTGTLAETTGVFTAIKMAKLLHAEDASITLTIIGYAAQREVLARILQEVENHSFIRLMGGDHPVPHTTIVEAITEADFGFICYPPNKSTFGRIPTKFYEYTALGLRILALPNSSLSTEITSTGIGLVFNEAESRRILLSRMVNFKTSDNQKSHFLWKNEESKLLSLFERL